MQPVFLPVASLAGSLRKYSEDEPRDDHGRWTDGSGGADPTHAKPVGFTEVHHDNPGGAWEMHEQAYADQEIAKGRKVVGSTTAEMRGRMPTAMVAALPGMLDEHLRTNLLHDDKANAIRASIEKDGVKQAIFVNVNHKGQVYINEGNHRAALAKEFKQASVPVHIAYYAGGEKAPGPFNLDALVKEFGHTKKAVTYLHKYSDDQLRDDRGRWTDGGAGDAGTSTGGPGDVAGTSAAGGGGITQAVINEHASAIVNLRESGAHPLGESASVDQIKTYLNDQVQERFGRALDPSNPADAEIAYGQWRADLAYQNAHGNGERNWYTTDIRDAFAITQQAIPQLSDPDNQKLFSVVAGVMSTQQTPRDAWVVAAEAMKYYFDHGAEAIPSMNPATGGLWAGTQTKMHQIELLNNLIREQGGVPQAMSYLFSEHTVADINRDRLQLGGIEAHIRGKMADNALGIRMFGPKVGVFIGNMNGVDGVTTDAWMTRGYRRIFGTNVLGEGVRRVDSPFADERRGIATFVNRLAKDSGVKPQSAQASLWFYEQSTYDQLGHRATAQRWNSSDGARRFVDRVAARANAAGTGKSGAGDSTGSGQGALAAGRDIAKALARLILSKFNPDEPRDDHGRWTDGGAGGPSAGDKPSAGNTPLASGGVVTVGRNGMLVDDKGKPVIVYTVDEAIDRLGKGQGIMFERPDQVVTLLDRIKSIVEEAMAAGKTAPVFDLCKVSVANSNLFCSDSMQIPRSQMPQLSGKPTAGSKADALPKDAKGGVNLTQSFYDHLTGQGVKIESTSLDASRMRASQNQLDGGKVAGMASAFSKNGIPKDSIFVSRENYVVDGHHRWAAEVALKLKTNGEVKVPVFRVDMPILQLLKVATTYSQDMGVMARALGKSLRVFVNHCKGVDCPISKYSPDEPRDDHGRWTDGAGPGATAAPSAGGARGAGAVRGLPDGVSLAHPSLEALRSALDRGAFDISVEKVRDGYGSDKTYDLSISANDIPAGWKTTARGESYDPKYFSINEFGRTTPKVEGLFADPEGFQEPGHIYRGMSYEEFTAARANGYIESKGTYNIGPQQVGVTLFSTQVGQAAYYASGFAPWPYKATPTRPAVLVKVRDPGNHASMPGLGEHTTEVGLRGRVPFDSVVGVRFGHVISVTPGLVEVRVGHGQATQGSAFAYSASIHWGDKEKSKSVVYVGKYSPDEPRDDHGRWTSGGAGDAPIAVAEAPGRFSAASESAYVTGKGKTTQVGQGYETGVHFTNEEAALMRGMVMTHNHPGGSAFSLEDLQFASLAGLREIRVVGTGADKEQFLYRASPNATGKWPGAPEILRSSYGINEALRAKYMPLVQRGELSPTRANQAHFHALNTELAKSLGYNYSRTQV